MEIDGLPDRFGLPFLSRVDSADRSLQLGELPHHIRAEIRLAETTGKPGVIRNGVGLLERVVSDPPRQRRDAVGLLSIAAQLLVEKDGREAGDARPQRGLAVCLPEKLRITEPRGEDAFRVARDNLRLLRLRVRDRQERGLQLSFLVDDRKVMLMMNHRRRQHFLRQLQELDGEMARDDGGVLHEVRHFLQERGMRRHETTDAATEPARMRFQLAPDPRFALRTVEDDEVFEQPGLVVLEGLDLDGAARAAARRQETMAVGLGAGPDVLHVRALRTLGSTDDEWHDAAAVHQHQPPDRPREDEVPFAVLEMGIPPHLLGKRQIAQQPAHDVRQHIDRGFATLPNPVGQIRALWRLVLLERGDVHAVFLRKPGRRRRGFSISLVCRGYWRSGHQFFEIGLALGKLRHPRRQTPGGAVAFRLGRGGEPDLLEARVEMPRELRRQSRQPTRRNLLAPDLNQQLAIHALGPFRDREGISDVRPGNPDRELPDPENVGGPLGDADAAARIKHVEQVRALETVLERGPDET